ncbi:hypothetical protein, partial [Niveispirillum lacus]|uniref:hypothetical protein n=1 Tax=Niveispirillum lacus TaxID=1981099 RepID=UPI001A9C3ACD
ELNDLSSFTGPAHFVRAQSSLKRLSPASPNSSEVSFSVMARGFEAVGLRAFCLSLEGSVSGWFLQAWRRPSTIEGRIAECLSSVPGQRTNLI